MVVRELLAKFGLKTDKKSISGAEKAIAGIKKAAVALAGIFVTGKIAQGISNIAKQTAALGDQIDKTSQQIGVNAQALQELQFAANLAGASNQDVVTSLRLLQKNMLEASQGTKSYVDDFALLGVTVTDTNGQLKSAEALLPELADGFAQLSSDTERTALAQTLLGRAGTKLIPLLKQGTQAIQEQRAEARSLGGILDKELIAASVEYTDTQRRLQSVTQGVRNVMAKKLLPAFTQATKGIIKFLRENRKLIATKLTEFLQRAISLVRRLSSLFIRVAVATTRWARDLSPVQKQLLKISAIALGLAAVLLLPGGSILILLGLIGLIIDDFETWRKGGESVIGDLVAGLDTLREQLGISEGAIEAIGEIFSRVFRFMQDVAFNWIQFFIDLFKKGPIQAFIDFKKRGFMIMDDLFGGLLSKAVDFVVNFARRLKDGIKEGFQAALSTVKSAVTAVVDIPATAPAAALAGGGGATLNQTSTLNVAITGETGSMDNRQTAGDMRRVVREEFERANREAAEDLAIATR